MPRWLILACTHFVVGITGFAAGIYTLPILTAPASPTEAALRSSTPEALYSGKLSRDLAGSDLQHWGEGEVQILPHRIAHIGRLSPGPDYKLYLAPHFVETEEAFLAIKDASARVGDVRTFNGFIMEVPADIDVRDYSAVVIWCEAFDQFISSAAYQPPRQARK